MSDDQKEIFQGGSEGPGHVATNVPADSEGQFNSLRQQKAMAESHYKDRLEEQQHEQHPSCANEDHSFAKHKPGGDDTLPGWSKIRQTM
ncbi:hypothetical protein FE257_006114 [Aspergillus nanangensis]|uniref:Uncharacterized protein n=1 Tax=Aspergillus nanangensis TaxID=2582783 RepID=A0AAD4GUX1_ASPNN|nr:hypothetical protein FE257_006114 [Aspergillus nanangensis]